MHAKEAIATTRGLKGLPQHMRQNKYMDIMVDSMDWRDAYMIGKAKDLDLIEQAQELHFMQCEDNSHINLFWGNTYQNWQADSHTRPTQHELKLDTAVFDTLQFKNAFTIDAMASGQSRQGNLPFISYYTDKEAVAQNIFSIQQFHGHIYCFPPLALQGAVFTLLRAQTTPATMILMDKIHERRTFSWVTPHYWPIVKHIAIHMQLLAPPHTSVLMRPSKQGGWQRMPPTPAATYAVTFVGDRDGNLQAQAATDGAIQQEEVSNEQRHKRRALEKLSQQREKAARLEASDPGNDHRLLDRDNATSGNGPDGHTRD